ncbi:MAG TPA: polysaccharide biosynthesis/export family protein [Usitatibacter sp.]|jgi:polysaccharide export outer membrane protein|nr:polysaccharide biosynthesis/export family protein [Usitatibacter sp.]
METCLSLRGAAFAVVGLLVASSAGLAGAAAEPELRLSDTISIPDPSHVAALHAPAAPESHVALTAADYRIGVEDLLEIQVFGVDQLSRTVRVNSLGKVSLPLIGAVAVGGLTAQEAEKSIAARLAESFLQDPQVGVFIKEYTTQRVTVEGAVQKPGIYPLRGQTTLLRALALAGGQGNMSDMQQVMIFRREGDGGRASQAYDVEKIRRGEVDDPVVANDDVVVVNRSPARAALRDSLFRDFIDTINPFSPFAH